MRSKFPLLWILQFALLFALSINDFVRPVGTLAFHRGQIAPQKVPVPKEPLYDWVLGLESIPVPNATVKDFFLDHEQVLHKGRDIWTPDDTSIADYLDKGNYQDKTAETENSAWEELENWILSASPAPPPEHADAIKKWFHAVDEIPVPSQALIKWVEQQDEPQLPPAELRALVLDARQTLPTSWQLASDFLRLSAPCIMAAALFTLLGLMTPSIRRPLARVFVIIAIFCTIAGLRNSTGPADWNATSGVVIAGLVLGLGMIISAMNAAPKLTTGGMMMGMISLWWIGVVGVAAFAKFEDGTPMARYSVVIFNTSVALFGIVNAYYWLVGDSEDPPQDDGGIAQRRPPQLWTTWLVQFVILAVNGLLALTYPAWIAELFVHYTYDHLTTDIVNDSVRILGAWTIGMALFSHFALGVGKDWIWQGISLIFCMIFAALAISTLVYGASGEYTIWAYMYGFQGVVFIPITAILLMRKDPWTTENVERAATDDWSISDLVVGPSFLWSSFWSCQRRLFQNGIGARGTLRVLPAPDRETELRPENSFFEPGKEFNIEMRFSNRICDDDAGLDIRGCALRFSQDQKSPLDLLFATGSFAPASNYLEFRNLLFANIPPNRVLEHDTFRDGLAAGMRRAPESFSALTFYDHFTLEWLTPEARHYLVRFRLIPSGDARSMDDQESGIPDEEDLQKLWDQDRRKGETRSRDYLRKEFEERIHNQSVVKFQLQAQFHEPDADDALDWYDATIEWDDDCPWIPLADVELTETLTSGESDLLRFDPSNLPSTLHVPTPSNLVSLGDPRELAAGRYRIAHVLGALRTTRRKLING